MTNFSVVLPIHGNRDGLRSMHSILGQNYPIDKVEVLIIEDEDACSAMDQMPPNIAALLFKVVAHHNQRLERAISRNEGMKAATKDWIIWLDSDDEFMTTLFYVLDYVIRRNPEYKIFNWGSVVHWEPKSSDEENYEPRTTIRPVAKILEATIGMERFKSGLIGAGSFCFHQSILDHLGGLPEHSSPYGFAELAKKEFPEFADPESDVYCVDTLGNPWGEDYFIVYKYTRHYKMKPIDFLGYCQHVRR